MGFYLNKLLVSLVSDGVCITNDLAVFGLH